MNKLKHKFKINNKQTPTTLTDATVFSKTHSISFDKPVTKLHVEKLVKQLIQDIGKPLAHNGIIVGHIKVLANVPGEEFLFLSLTRLDRLDVKSSSEWQSGLSSEFTSVTLDINVLVFGHSKKAVEEIVNESLAILRRDSSCGNC
ncbi:hypothetical protein SOV_36490 [Sporomusa ovata DSM 2662]|uniref:Uncharacterized protein n=1 Tax=Sporomusa ovata TaxID=2378 RepID=A0A0U1L6K0_9FIRM|nr:hypothetical protein [Sporomusa ovata]EQB24798.1 hypothetical protein SOV_6c02120 [Sporomusa ovata DSM 2662]CQR75145.1 hypothetical protein SpAn4DRAFT_4509 [Sporomusa ovata]